MDPLLTIAVNHMNIGLHVCNIVRFNFIAIPHIFGILRVNLWQLYEKNIHRQVSMIDRHGYIC